MILPLETNPERWVRLPSVDSTNSYAMREHLPAGSVVTADRQTAGRGRMGRTWEATPGSLFFTGVLEFAPALVPDERLSLFAILSGVAVLRAAATFVPGEYRIKEPNDVLVLRPSPGKVAGVLVESEITEDLRRVFIGIGVNLVHAPPPLDSMYPPAALLPPDWLVAGRAPVSPDLFAGALIVEINARLDQMTAVHTPAFVGEAQQFSPG